MTIKHENKKKFECEICQFTCLPKSGLKKHKYKVHKKEVKPCLWLYIITIYCGGGWGDQDDQNLWFDVQRFGLGAELDQLPVGGDQVW